MAEELAQDIIELKPSDVARYFESLLKDPHYPHDNTALVGAPGIGKSSLIEQAAEAADHDLIISLPALEDSTEPGGIPWFAADHSRAQKLLFEQAYRAVHALRPTVWHLEDFGQAPDSTQKGYMQWAQARMVNGHKLPDYVTITMATNRRTDRAGVVGILEPVKGRFCMLHMISDVDDFCDNLFLRGAKYGLEEDMILAGASYIKFRPEMLNKFKASADMTNSPTERNWVRAFRAAQRKQSPHIEVASIAGCVGTGAAADFLGFLRVFRAMPKLDMILSDPRHAIIPEEPSAQCAIATGLARMATPANFGAICEYAGRLEKAGFGECAGLMVRDSVRCNDKVTNTRAYIELSSSTVGKLMTGRAA